MIESGCIVPATTSRSPWTMLVVATIAGYLAVSALLFALGELLVKGSFTSALRGWDTDVGQWFVAHRTPTLNDVSAIGSRLADTIPVVVAAILIDVVLLAFGRRRELWVIALGLGLELSVFLTVNTLVDRPRPDVVKLGSEPSTASFPSGHTAATFVVYAAVLVLSLGRAPFVGRSLLVTLLVAMDTLVGYSRVYRGMHNVTDVVAGALMGAACLGVAAVRDPTRSGRAESRPGPEAALEFGVGRRRPSQKAGPMKVAVIAHSGKQLGGGLSELRATLAHHGVENPMWFEVPKSRKAPAKVARALADGAELIVVWGGDGMVQRCADAMAGSGATLAIVPAGTANLLAGNLGIPKDLERAVEIGLGGVRRPLDLGRMNGERFAVMAGIGFDALMIRDADKGAKDRFGRIAYVWAGAKHLTEREVGVRIRVDGSEWFSGRAACVLFGNVGTLTGGVKVFPDARPDDGVLDLGVLSVHGLWQWTRVIARPRSGASSAHRSCRRPRAARSMCASTRNGPTSSTGSVWEDGPIEGPGGRGGDHRCRAGRRRMIGTIVGRDDLRARLGGQTPSLRARSTSRAGTMASRRPTGNSSCITSTRKFARISAVKRSLTVRLGT